MSILDEHVKRFNAGVRSGDFPTTSSTFSTRDAKATR